MFYVFKLVKKKKRYHIGGGKFSPYPFKMKKYPNLKALKSDISKCSKRTGFYYEKVKHKKNPKKSTLKDKVNEAARRLESFTGHKAEVLTKHNLKIPKVVYKLGDCDGIAYTATRDGMVEKYYHSFKKRARPVLAVNHDGSQLYIINGSYSVNEGGIADD